MYKIHYKIIIINIITIIITIITTRLDDAQYTKKALTQFADNGGSDQHAHPCSLTWAFSVRRHKPQ